MDTVTISANYLLNFSTGNIDVRFFVFRLFIYVDLLVKNADPGQRSYSVDAFSVLSYQNLIRAAD